MLTAERARYVCDAVLVEVSERQVARDSTRSSIAAGISTTSGRYVGAQSSGQLSGKPGPLAITVAKRSAPR